MHIATLIYTALFGTKVGEDQFGNRYYKRTNDRFNKDTGERRREQRWVIYKGIPEPSKVPAEWHGWLHYMHNLEPTKLEKENYEWEKAHIPNLTGSKLTYKPEGHVSKGGKRAPATGDYEAWDPSKE